MKITVIGCGRWGSFIAWYLNKIKHEDALWKGKFVSLSAICQ